MEDAYERLRGDAIVGDQTLDVCENYVEEAWRIVDPVVKASAAISEYEPGTREPAGVAKRVAPPGGWHNSLVKRRRHAKKCGTGLSGRPQICLRVDVSHRGSHDTSWFPLQGPQREFVLVRGIHAATLRPISCRSASRSSTMR